MEFFHIGEGVFVMEALFPHKVSISNLGHPKCDFTVKDLRTDYEDYDCKGRPYNYFTKEDY